METKRKGNWQVNFLEEMPMVNKVESAYVALKLAFVYNGIKFVKDIDHFDIDIISAPRLDVFGKISDIFDESSIARDRIVIQAMGFIRELKEVQAHGTTKLHVIHTNDLRQVEAIIDWYEQHLQIQCNKIVGVDVEYKYGAAHKQKAALIQLSIGKTHSVLLFQLSTVEHRCTVFDNFLLDSRYTFVGFSIDQYIEKLNRVALHITHFVDIQKQWRVPRSTKYFDSLVDVSSMLIDDYYMSMKHKLTNEDHKRWACMPLSMKRVHYATKDAYAVYEIWSRITVTHDGLHCAMLEKFKKHGRTWGDDGW
ncbi:hypothetical protein ZWY2020_023992 [Hordeum vulgare]|nr:hypothetical protein ZWY2020_023992 [Hordeum vulgare]